jgi:trans-aconitate methyltransferase
MRKMVLRVTAGPGMDSASFFNVSEEVTKEHLAEYAWQAAVDWAESFGLEPYPDEQEEEEDAAWACPYSEDISGWFELYSPEKHDGLRVGQDNDWQEL